MEDRYIASLDVSDSVSVFGIFDGHGGSYVSNLAQQTFIKELKGSQYFIDKNYQEALIHTFLRIDKIITDGEKCVRPSRNSKYRSVGSTAIVVLTTETEIYVANAGDCRAVMCKNGKMLPLSTDHKPNLPSEKQRI